MVNQTTSLEVTDLTCIRGEAMIFRGLSFAVNPGEGLIVRGPNGAGKSSLLRLLAGLLRPDAGHILFDGASVADDPPRYRRNIAWLGHQDGVKASETAAEIVAFRARLHGNRGADVIPFLNKMGMEAHAETPARYLSAGQKRRVALCGVMAAGAKLWLIDEPTTALDAEAAALFHAALKRHLGDGGMAIVTTHDAFPAMGGVSELALSQRER